MRIHKPTQWQGRILQQRYRLLQPLGLGSVGELWLAEDTRERRQVVARLFPAVLATDKQYLQTFEQEAHKAASLNHPYILPIYYSGLETLPDNRLAPFLIMPYAPDGSLRARIQAAQGLLPIKESMHYLKQLAQALDYAHGQQVLHRALKPTNILLHQQAAFLTDFGLTRILPAPQDSQAYTAINTAEYMAPELARGHAEPASDRYSFAMIAYQLFTGVLPFTGESPYAVLTQQFSRPLPPPHQVNPAIPSPVADTLTRGLAKQPAARFPSCTAFVEALERGWQVTITPSGDPDATIVAPWSKRHPYNQPAIRPPQATDPSMPVQRPAASAPASHTMQAPTNERGPFPPTAAAPGQSNPRLNRRTFFIGGAVAVAIGGAGALTTSIILANQRQDTVQHSSAPEPTPAQPGPGPQKLIAGVPLLTCTAHNDKVWAAAWDPQSRYIASAGDDTWVALWDIQSALQKKPDQHQTLKKPLLKWSFTNGFQSNSLSWSPDGKQLIVIPSTDASLYLLNPFKKNDTPQKYHDQQKSTELLPPSYENVAWSPQGGLIASTVDFHNDLLLWQIGKTDGPIDTLHYNPPKITVPGFNGLAWSSDGKYLAGLTITATVVIWEVATRKQIQVLTPPTNPNPASLILRNALQWSPAEPHKLLVSTTDTVTVWDAPANKLLFSLGTNDRAALTPPDPNPTGWTPHTNGLCWSPNGRYIAGSYGRSRSVYIWDTQQRSGAVRSDGAFLQTMIFGEHGGHTDTIIEVSWSPNGRCLATTSFDKTVIVWKVDGAS